MDTNFLVKRDVADLVNTSSYLRKLLFEGVSVHMINKGNPVLAWGAKSGLRTEVPSRRGTLGVPKGSILTSTPSLHIL